MCCLETFFPLSFLDMYLFIFLSLSVATLYICILLWDIITMLLPFNCLEIVVDVFIFVVCLWA
jgi:hypothetical protein